MNRENRKRINEGALPRENSLKQLDKLQRTIDASGGDIESKVRKTSKKKESSMPNTVYMDNPMTSGRKISSYENFTKTDAHVKTKASKSTEPKGMRTFEQYKIETINEELFMLGGNYIPGVFVANGSCSGQDDWGNNYDIKEGDILRIADYFNDTDSYRVEIDNKYYNLSSDVLRLNLDIKSLKSNESLDGEELLSAKQKKLPDALKKSIIKRLKKSGKKEDKEEKDDDKDDDKKDNKKDDKDDKKSGSDEEKYLTPKQRKLPEGLKKGIIERAKKKSKVNESKKEDHVVTKIDNWIQDLDSDVIGTTDDKLRPMFVNRPNRETRPSYDILRAGKYINVDGQDCQIIGLKNGKVLVDSINKDNKHEVIELSMKDALKNISKTNKKNKNED